MRRSDSRINRWGAGLALLMLAGGVPWAQAAVEPVAVDMSPGQITFQARVPGESASLRVSCSDGTYIEREYPNTGVVSFVPVNEKGQVVAAGPCKYEFRIHPVVNREAVDAAYAAGDERRLRELWEAAAKQAYVSSGTFEVVGGLIVAPRLELEEEVQGGEAHEHGSETHVHE